MVQYNNKLTTLMEEQTDAILDNRSEDHDRLQEQIDKLKEANHEIVLRKDRHGFHYMHLIFEQYGCRLSACEMIRQGEAETIAITFGLEIKEVK